MHESSIQSVVSEARLLETKSTSLSIEFIERMAIGGFTEPEEIAAINTELARLYIKQGSDKLLDLLIREEFFDAEIISSYLSLNQVTERCFCLGKLGKIDEALDLILKQNRNVLDFCLKFNATIQLFERIRFSLNLFNSYAFILEKVFPNRDLLEFIPLDSKLSQIATFLKRLFIDSFPKTFELNLNLKISDLEMKKSKELSMQKITIDHSTLCSKCQRKIGKSAFVLANSNLTHLNCFLVN